MGMVLYFYRRRGHVELATRVLIRRTGEAVPNGVCALGSIVLVSMAEVATQAISDTDVRLVLVMIPSTRQVTLVGAFWCAIGSTAFARIRLRARLAPRYVAAPGVTGSLVPAVGMPLHIVGALRGCPTQRLWMLMFLFECALGVWLLKTGGREPEVTLGGAYSSGAARAGRGAARKRA